MSVSSVGMNITGWPRTELLAVNRGICEPQTPRILRTARTDLSVRTARTANRANRFPCQPNRTEPLQFCRRTKEPEAEKGDRTGTTTSQRAKERRQEGDKEGDTEGGREGDTAFSCEPREPREPHYPANRANLVSCKPRKPRTVQTVVLANRANREPHATRQNANRTEPNRTEPWPSWYKQHNTLSYIGIRVLSLGLSGGVDDVYRIYMGRSVGWVTHGAC